LAGARLDHMDTPAAPCAAGLPADAPRLTVADTQAGASLGQICEVTTQTDGSPSYQLIAAIADDNRRQQFLTLAPYDGQALPVGCTVSARRRAYIQIKEAWLFMPRLMPRLRGADTPPMTYQL